MNHFQTYQVFPAVPKPLSFLIKLSGNLWWSWNLDAIDLFRRISPRLWVQSGRNPIAFGTLISQKQLKELSKDKSYLAHLNRVREKFENEVDLPLKTEQIAFPQPKMIAYFSMEFGIHESLPLFAGGLGVLAGDHLKAASDMGLPMVAVGLLYRHGYFHQYLGPDGGQQEAYPETDLYQLPITRAKTPNAVDIRISISGPQGEILADVWEIKVGRISLYLLDANIPENAPEVRDITSRLYAGDPKQRLAQEVLLGIGGMRALEAAGINPAICHLNEGHCAFAGIERLTQVMARHQVDLTTALEIVPRTTVFTTHTPVAAGHDEFPTELVKPYLAPLQERLGVKTEHILGWGQPEGNGPDAPLSMFVLALRMSQNLNGVSQLHGETARRMWAHVWPRWPEEEIPISHITNGVHVPSWISIENALLFERYLRPDWHLNCRDPETVARIEKIYDEELWRAHEMSRSRLIRTSRELLVKQYARRNAPRALIRAVEAVLDPDVLTIGFARRFAAYKRANLLLRDPERLEAIINSESQPVQFIFAGKAHPKDSEGKELLKQLIAFARRESVRHRFVFIEDYDINVTRHLVQGTDVWLNTPRRPLEACGTSGMKAAVNGVLNVSILDGWWCEGYSEDTGWAIGQGETYSDFGYQDAVESQALFNVLEDDVIPCFYERKNGELPARWIRMMKKSMQMAMHHFCAHRMTAEYTRQFYQPAVQFQRTILENGADSIKKMGIQRQRLLALWKDIRIQPPVQTGEGLFRVGQTFQATTEVNLGELLPEEVDVELYYGRMKSIDTVTAGKTEQMSTLEERDQGHYLYGCTVNCELSGRFGFTVRVTPRGDNQIKYTPGLITWA